MQNLVIWVPLSARYTLSVQSQCFRISTEWGLCARPGKHIQVLARRITLKNAVSKSFREAPACFNSYKRYANLPFYVLSRIIIFVRIFHVRSEDTVTPSTLVVLTLSVSLPWILIDHNDIDHYHQLNFIISRFNVQKNEQIIMNSSM